MLYMARANNFLHCIGDRNPEFDFEVIKMKTFFLINFQMLFLVLLINKIEKQAKLDQFIKSIFILLFVLS